MRLPRPFRAPAAQRGQVALVLTVAAMAGAALLLVRLADVVLLVFASILLAMLLQAVAKPLREKAGFGRHLAMIVAFVLLVAAVVLASWLFGAQLSAQLTSLTVLVPRSWDALEARLAGSSLGDLVLAQIRSARLPDNFMITWAMRFIGNVAMVLAAAVIVIAGAAYLAFHPETYVRGALKLVPQSRRARAAEVLEACRRALTQWLLGQSISMIFIAATTSAGLWVAGVPAPLALGLLAGLGHAVPVVGPWATAAPGLLIALAQGPETLGWAFLIYLITGQFESNVLTPLVLRQMSEVPMAVTLFAVVAMGALLGPLGVLMATPLAVLAYVLTRTVYMEDVLGERPTPLEVLTASRAGRRSSRAEPGHGG
jgi:predicted PurR-regulated permease PerM